MTVARLERGVNLWVGKPLTWLLFLAWLLASLLLTWSKLGIAWLKRQYQEYGQVGASASHQR